VVSNYEYEAEKQLELKIRVIKGEIRESKREKNKY